MDGDLALLFDFIRFSAELRQVYCSNNAASDSDRKESVAEHSWHLALVAWTLHSAFEQEFKIAISQERIIKMCLIHDLVEIVVGDASIWNTQERIDKAAQEEGAAQGIFARLPSALGEEMLALWHEFEGGETIEAKIARGIDRINPAFMRLLSGHGWYDVSADAAYLDRIQLPRLDFSETFKQLYVAIRAEAIETGLLQA